MPAKCLVSGVGVQVDSFLHELIVILKVACHSFLEVLLSVANVELIHHPSSNLVDSHWNSTNVSVLTFACASGVYAVAAVLDFEVH
jgi:hypothetical protein